MYGKFFVENRTTTRDYLYLVNWYTVIHYYLGLDEQYRTQNIMSGSVFQSDRVVIR